MTVPYKTGNYEEHRNVIVTRAPAQYVPQSRPIVNKSITLPGTNGYVTFIESFRVNLSVPELNRRLS